MTEILGVVVEGCVFQRGDRTVRIDKILPGKVQFSETHSITQKFLLRELPYDVFTQFLKAEGLQRVVHTTTIAYPPSAR